MKRFSILTVIAVVTVATSSGCRTCGGSMLNFFRGGSCDTCSTETYGVDGSSYAGGVVYEGDTMLPPVTTEVLPGPRATTQ